jgi:hypothetical protein
MEETSQLMKREKENLARKLPLSIKRNNAVATDQSQM